MSTKEFIPTYLYIKQHTITGKLYFGKTISDNVLNYTGSGTKWSNHIKKHGKEHVITLWYQLYYNPFDLVADALSFSYHMDIVESNSWYNQIPENGLGGPGFGFSSGGSKKGRKMSLESRLKMSQAKLGIPRSDATKEKLSKYNTGKKLSQETKDKMSKYNTGKKLSQETKDKMSKSKKGKLKSADRVNAILQSEKLKN